MSYVAAIDALNALTPELFSRPQGTRRKFSLAEIGILLDELGNPQRHFASVLMAGTNGKGSTASTLASILMEAGVRVGLYTSPHLERVNERIRVAGVEIGNDDFARDYVAVENASGDLVRAGRLAEHPSFFETITAMAFLHFAERQVEIAVLEVGMGGRLDATNIVEPLISVITDISLDHMEWLGSTIGEITREKAGILRRGGTMITLPQHPEANRVLAEVGTALEVRAVSASPYTPPAFLETGKGWRVQLWGRDTEIAPALAGEHQYRNVALAVAAAVELKEGHGFPVTAEAVERGVRKTRWAGRLEEFRAGEQRWVLDVAHNPAGAWALRAGLRGAGGAEGREGTLIFSCLRDKPVAEMGQILFPLFERVIFAPIRSPRATPDEDLLRAAEGTGSPAVVAGSVAEALEMAEREGGGKRIVVSGSVYLVGEARPMVCARTGIGV
jgi:dihydrofolate synthase/folylpolyglutamate synthase